MMISREEFIRRKYAERTSSTRAENNSSQSTRRISSTLRVPRKTVTLCTVCEIVGNFETATRNLLKLPRTSQLNNQRACS